MKILVTGPRGFIGSKVMAHYPNAMAAPSLQNISDDQVKALLEQVQPDVIIHTAAISDMPACERDPEGSYRANVLLPLMLAKHNPGAKLIVFSSDQVYNGCTEPGPYDETIVNPVNLYAKEKVEMENRVLDTDPNAVMLRAEWMYDFVAPKGNFVRNMLAAEGPIACSSREYRGVTYAREVAEAMDAVQKLPGGAYNFGSETTKSMLEITKEFLAMAGKTNPLLDRDPGHNLWMNCGKARAYGVNFSNVSDGLKRCLKDYNLLKADT